MYNEREKLIHHQQLLSPEEAAADLELLRAKAPNHPRLSEFSLSPRRSADGILFELLAVASRDEIEVNRLRHRNQTVEPKTETETPAEETETAGPKTETETPAEETETAGPKTETEAPAEETETAGPKTETETPAEETETAKPMPPTATSSKKKTTTASKKKTSTRK